MFDLSQKNMNVMQQHLAIILIDVLICAVTDGNKELNPFLWAFTADPSENISYLGYLISYAHKHLSGIHCVIKKGPNDLQLDSDWALLTPMIVMRKKVPQNVKKYPKLPLHTHTHTHTDL